MMRKHNIKCRLDTTRISNKKQNIRKYSNKITVCSLEVYVVITIASDCIKIAIN
jgi:hypothetical protein